MKLKSRFLLLTMFIFIIVIIPMQSVRASEEILPTAYSNLNISLRSKSELVALDSGYMRVFYDSNKICIEYYDDNFNIKSKKSVAMELDIWGGFFAGEDAYYVVEGQNNKEENNDTEVIRVIKYDTSWNKLGTAKITSNSSLFGGEVRYPFDYGCVEMCEYNGTLYIVTGHEGYVDDSLGQGHQGFLMIAVDESTMTGKIVKSDLWHSFAQYIEYKESYLYVLEQSEGSRCTMLSKYDEETLNGESISVLDYGGSRTSTWAVACYASVDHMAISSNNIICLGTSIDQSKYDNVSSDLAHNIYLTVTPMNDFSEEATEVKWLTDYNGDGKSFLGTKITKINDNRFMISWEEHNTSQTAQIDDTLSGSILHYIFVDGSGNKISEEYTAAASISDCHPIVKDSKIVFYASNDNMVNLYLIDANSGNFSKIYNVAGENVTWQLDNDTLVFTGAGAISIDTEAKYRFPVSSTASTHSYSSSDNSWKPIREKVKKIKISKGITSIPDNAFNYFSNLTEVEIEDGVKSIGKEAFAYCNSLSEITIPSSVTSIGDDFLWTGYYWVGSNSHVVRATIYASSDSYAIKYAKQEGISFELTGTARFKLSETTISNISNQTYTGQKIYPTITVKDGNTSLFNGRDYTVSYSNNKNVGTATVTITGKGNYTGTVTKTFKILAKNLSKVKTTVDTSNKTYTGKALTTSIKLVDGSTVLKNDTDYTVSYSNHKNPGEATVTITGKGNYTGTITKTFIIKPKKVTGFKVKEQKTDSIKLSWSKVTGKTGYKIYSYNYKKEKWEYVGKTDKTTYTIKKLKAGTTYKFRVRAYVTVSKKDYFGSYTSSLKTTTQTKKPSISKLTTKNKKATIKWKNVSGASGYQIYMATSKKGKYSRIKTITKGSTTSYTKSKLKKNKKYYFKIRTYRTVDGKKVYSSFSSVKSIKIK